MKILVLGTRGIPDIPGGVETHCEELYPRLVRHHNCEVTVINRSPYIKNKAAEFRGVRLKHIYAPKLKSLEAIFHSLLGIFYAWRYQPDILHIHAIGPSIVTPLARLLGMKVVITHHGPDYDRGKWGFTAKKVLQFGERMGARYAHRIIVISQVIADLLARKYGLTDTCLIHNGVSIPGKTASTDYLASLGLEPGRYLLGIGRFVEEKGFHDLIQAWTQLREKDSIKLVLVGNADHETGYSRNLKTTAEKNGIILTGFIKGEPLQEIFSHARLFVMPSYHEGLPITLLEALAYDLDVLVSDIPANLEIGLEKEDYFTTGNISKLAVALQHKLQNGKSADYTILLARYDWDTITSQTWEVYQSIISRS